MFCVPYGQEVMLQVKQANQLLDRAGIFWRLVCFSSCPVWGRHPSLSHLSADEGPAGRSVLSWSQQFPFWVISMGQKTAAEAVGTRAGGLLPGFFSRTWHGCAEGGASGRCQLYRSVLAFLTKQDTFFCESWARRSSQWNFQFTGIFYIFWWETVEEGGWERIDPGWLKLIRRQICLVASKLNFCFEQKQISDFLNARVSMYVFVNRSPVNICVSVFMS